MVGDGRAGARRGSNFRHIRLVNGISIIDPNIIDPNIIDPDIIDPNIIDGIIIHSGEQRAAQKLTRGTTTRW